MAIANIPKNQVISRNSIEQREHEDAAAARRVLLVDEEGSAINENNPLPASVTIQGETQPDELEIFNLSALAANTEYSQQLPDNTSKFYLKARGNAKLQFAFAAGESGTKFWTVFPGETYPVDGLKLSGKTIYVRSSKPNETVELLVWTY